jgi:hypothetical protein
MAIWFKRAVKPDTRARKNWTERQDCNWLTPSPGQRPLWVVGEAPPP